MWSSHHVQWGDPWKNLVPGLCASHSTELLFGYKTTTKPVTGLCDGRIQGWIWENEMLFGRKYN